MATPGFFFDLKVQNFNSGTLTIRVGAGTSMIGTNTIAAGATHDFVFEVTSATTMTLYG